LSAKTGKIGQTESSMHATKSARTFLVIGSRSLPEIRLNLPRMLRGCC
jgi:hypothetical protein